MSIKVRKTAGSSVSRVVRWPEVSSVRRPASPSPWEGATLEGEPAPPAEVDGRAEEAYRQGFEEAHRQLAEEAERRVQPLLERLSASLANLAGLRARIRTETEAELVRLAIAIARRILHRELTLDPDSIHGLVKAALQKVQTREIQRVRLHRDQEAFVRESLSKLMPSGSIEIIVDPALQPGDVIFESAQGDLDASIDTQLREIERGFADRLEI
jgi:flagellar assembly protein FliH